ncbi:MAG: hypothetical protein HEQ32_01715 [Vampirovibrio sp.]
MGRILGNSGFQPPIQNMEAEKKAKEAAYKAANPPLNMDHGASIRGCKAQVKEEDGSPSNFSVSYNGAQLNLKATECNDGSDRYVASWGNQFLGKTTQIYNPATGELKIFTKNPKQFLNDEPPTETRKFVDLKSTPRPGDPDSSDWTLQDKPKP